jgi:thioredoxin-like negative regulator of GroEL
VRPQRPTPAETGERLREVLSSPSYSVARMQGLAELLARTDRDGIEALALAYAEAYGRLGRAHSFETRVVMSRWAELDPLLALESALTFEGEKLRRDAASEVARRWAIDNPVEALSYVKDIRQQDRLKSQLWHSIAEGWTLRDDAEDSTSMIAALPPEWSRERITRRLARTLLSAGGSGRLTRWAEAVPADATAGFRRVAFRKAALVLFHEASPAAATAWLEQRESDPDAQSALLVIAGEWTAAQPQQTLDWLFQRPASDGRYTAIGNAFGQWARDDFEVALAWLDQHYDSDPEGLDAAASTAILALSRTDRGRAFEFAERIPEGASQDAALTVVARHWYAEDPDAALLWIARSDLPRELKTRAREPLDPRQGRNARRAVAADRE